MVLFSGSDVLTRCRGTLGHVGKSNVRPRPVLFSCWVLRRAALERKKKESRPPLVACSFCSLQKERATTRREVVALLTRVIASRRVLGTAFHDGGYAAWFLHRWRGSQQRGGRVVPVYSRAFSRSTSWNSCSMRSSCNSRSRRLSSFLGQVRELHGLPHPPANSSTSRGA